MLRDGTLGVGESYMDGWWDCEALDVMIDKVTRARVGFGANWALLTHVAKARLFNLQVDRAFEVGSDTTTSATISTGRCWDRA